MTGSQPPFVHILLRVPKSKTMKETAGQRDRDRPRPPHSPSSLSSPINPFLSSTQRHSSKQTSALTRTRAYVTCSPHTQLADRGPARPANEGGRGENPGSEYEHEIPQI